MERQTREHIQTAERNRDLARWLISPSVASQLTAPPYEWATVVAFYAAVHYVNAYLWERYRVEPSNHAERGRYVQRDPVLRRCQSTYARLQDAGYRSRYTRLHRIAQAQALGLVNIDLANVESVVMAAL